jgi:hypothetical protein
VPAAIQPILAPLLIAVHGCSAIGELRGLRLAGEKLSYSRKELVFREWLDEHREEHGIIAKLVAIAGHQHNGCGGAPAGKHAGERRTVQVRHSEIRDNDINRGVVGQCRDGLKPIVGLVHSIAARFEHPPDKTANGRLVVHDQDGGTAGRGCARNAHIGDRMNVTSSGILV